MMGTADGFRWERRKNGDVAISHRGRHATILRGAKARSFIDDVDGLDQRDDAAQQLMARLTGNYKRGNERQARQHPRSGGR